MFLKGPEVFCMGCTPEIPHNNGYCQPEHMEPHTPIDHGNHDSHELSPSNTVRGNKNVTQKSLKINI